MLETPIQKVSGWTLRRRSRRAALIDNGAVEGTGIGLVMTKKLIEQMGGNIGAESTIGAGSEFWFELSIDGIVD